MNEIIKEKLKNIDVLEDDVREHINTTRYQNILISDSGNWDQICCSLDTINDTLCAISDYIEGDYPEKVGLKYLYTYGVLQALFIQQDAMSHLSEAFKIEYKHSGKIKKIRNIRNAAIGHPTKQDRGTPDGRTYYNYISRMSLSQENFTLMRSPTQGKIEFIDIELLPIIHDQINEISRSYEMIANTLKEADRMHKEKYKDQLLINLFHSSMGYAFEKIAQAIHSQDSNNRHFGLSMLAMVQETYQKFEQALRERGDISEYIEHDLEEYKHALLKLEAYLTDPSSSSMINFDARIYHSYIRNENKHFEQIAREIDESYKTIKGDL